MVVVKSFVPISNWDQAVVQVSRTGFQPVYVGNDGQSRVLRGTSPSNRLLFRDYS